MCGPRRERMHWWKQPPETVQRRHGRHGRWKRAWENPSRSEWAYWSFDQSPVARRMARMDYERDFGGLAGASGSIPARVGGAGTMMSSAFERGGQLGPGSANVSGTQPGQPDAQQPPLQAGAAPRSSSGAAEASSAVTRACPVASRAV